MCSLLLIKSNLKTYKKLREIGAFLFTKNIKNNCVLSINYAKIISIRDLGDEDALKLFRDS